ncbi:hypothetical protein SAMN05444483_102226 [Salegentibacter echinorum]|uniref:Uncharacterized protein n=1 Tax=Salegentibacter echinorum TaxID=1073325 RepID=A0A1M5E4A4_SALEC|nr:hypothetical protein [Salegentibacter echinorum]SHF74026.1 hypothetical protein SAMN05444483_102226 [Salegentibacter echinorum]
MFPDTNLLHNLLQAAMMIPFLYLITQYIFKKIKEKHDFFSVSLMNKLFFYHLIFGGIYYCYAFFNPSDSKRYFSVPGKEDVTWSGFLKTGTSFIDFLSYPFINFLGFSYEMMMLLFTWVGFMGFVYAYLFFKESISLDIKIFKRINFLTLILFLPNMHFWTASLGKGAPIFLGLMLFAYALRKPKNRMISLSVGSLLVFAIRPHMFLLLAGAGLFAIFFNKDQVSLKQKAIFGGVIAGTLLLFHKQILGVVNLGNSQNLIADFLSFTENRAGKLDNATSGVPMNDYSLIEKFFTFWFRPLFFDAPGILGIVVSVENFIYLLIFGKLFRKSFLGFLKSAPAHVKLSLVLFFTSSFAMTFVMSNLGIILRQKSMIMYFLFFVIYYFMAYEKDTVFRLKQEVRTRNLKKAA